jgi:excisionase family DNA binding protein
MDPAVTTGTDVGSGQVGYGAWSMEELIEAAVERAVRRSIAPLVARNSPQPAVYTVAQAADVLQLSQDTIGRMVRKGILPRVPCVGAKILIPIRAIEVLAGVPASQSYAEDDRAPVGDLSSRRSINSAAPRSEPGTKCL